VRTIALPVRPDVPRFETGGPAVSGDIGVVSSSQFGFVAVDWRHGGIAWAKPAGEHVAPPLLRDHRDPLPIRDCVWPPAVPYGEHLLGCLRVVTTAGADEAYLAIHGPAKTVAKFAAEAGTQDVWPDGEHAVRWRRGEQAVALDLVTGAAVPAAI